MMGWPIRQPGRPYRWLRSLLEDVAADECPIHQAAIGDRRGVCGGCIAESRRAYAERFGVAIDTHSWTVCNVCGYPIHPAAELLADGSAARACPSCDL